MIDKIKIICCVQHNEGEVFDFVLDKWDFPELPQIGDTFFPNDLCNEQTLEKIEKNVGRNGVQGKYKVMGRHWTIGEKGEKSLVIDVYDTWQSISEQEIPKTLSWFRKQIEGKCSGRLENILKFIIELGINPMIEDVTKRDFLKWRNAGKGTWNEFEKLRSEILKNSRI